MDYCVYGCGQEGIFEVTKAKKKCCSEHFSNCPVLKKKNSDGVKRNIRENNVNYKERYETLPQESKDAMAWRRNKNCYDDLRLSKNCNLKIDDILDEKSIINSSLIRKILIDSLKIEERCDICGINEWQGSKLNVHLDHINGIGNDNRLENLRFLCPNCHSQTDTYCGKNINNGKIKVSDDELILAIKESINICQVLIKVGLAPKGGNYGRVYKILSKYNLNFNNAPVAQ